jgi:catechol 2,3-dioxygenase-like lactoylglutathione lyase family enzyme
MAIKLQAFDDLCDREHFEWRIGQDGLSCCDAGVGGGIIQDGSTPAREIYSGLRVESSRGARASGGRVGSGATIMIEAISAITLATHDMRRAVRFYASLGFEMLYGGETAAFTSFRAGPGYLNLIAQGEEKQWSWWGRVIFYVGDVDATFAQALAAGHQPSTSPRDAEWGERYFHLTDPDGHELSFARPLEKPA